MILLVASFAACARKEKPKAPEKKMQSFELSPTAVPVLASTNAAVAVAASNQAERVEGPRTVVRRDPMADGRPTPKKGPPMTPEQRRQMRQMESDYAHKVIQVALEKAQLAYDLERQELEKTEVELREKDEAVKAAYARMLDVRNAYEAACGKDIPGYTDLVKESSQLRASLAELMARKSKGEAVDSEQLASINRRFNAALSAISQMRGQANAAVPGVAQALQDVIKVQGAYEQCLVSNKEYSQAKVKPDKTAAEIARLTSMQGQ
jgi:hypothetical protein